MVMCIYLFSKLRSFNKALGLGPTWDVGMMHWSNKTLDTTNITYLLSHNRSANFTVLIIITMTIKDL